MLSCAASAQPFEFTDLFPTDMHTMKCVNISIKRSNSDFDSQRESRRHTLRERAYVHALIVNSDCIRYEVSIFYSFFYISLFWFLSTCAHELQLWRLLSYPAKRICCFFCSWMQWAYRIHCAGRAVKQHECESVSGIWWPKTEPPNRWQCA